MTPDTTLDPIEVSQSFQPPSTVGMTTKVVKGSLWTLAGQVAPFAVSFFATPFVIRFLGSEAYGVLLLVGLIPMYFSFADFGMGVASTKFSSEAYARGDSKDESEIVWTSTAVAALCSFTLAVPIFLFSGPIVAALNVPEHLLTAASIGLKLTSVAFVLTVLASVLNSPMLARLRMDLNTVTQAGPKILLAAGTPLVLYLGGGIIGATGWALVVAIATVSIIVYFSARLLPDLFHSGANSNQLRPLLEFGVGWVFGMMAVVLLVNLDKLLLTRMVSVTSLAHYSIAFTFANVATLFGSAMMQSMIPAFSQLITPEKKQEFHALFGRAVRLNLIWILPVATFLFLIAKTFFTIWAGPEFGEESTLPFYIFLLGIVFNIPAYVPYASIIAAGRTKALAKLYWCELVLYTVLLVVLIGSFGIVGAAVAWTTRVFVDLIAETLMAHHFELVAFADLATLRIISALLTGMAVLAVPIVVYLFYSENPVLVIGLSVLSVSIYCVVMWSGFVEKGERVWLRDRARRFVTSYTS